jgi:hypothetical protein
MPTTRDGQPPLMSPNLALFRNSKALTTLSPMITFLQTQMSQLHQRIAVFAPTRALAAFVANLRLKGSLWSNANRVRNGFTFVAWVSTNSACPQSMSASFAPAIRQLQEVAGSGSRFDGQKILPVRWATNLQRSIVVEDIYHSTRLPTLTGNWSEQANNLDVQQPHVQRSAITSQAFHLIPPPLKRPFISKNLNTRTSLKTPFSFA